MSNRTSTAKTTTGIKRPRNADFLRWEAARQHARNLNVAKGRGFRALKAADGQGYAVIFRPAVASNKQRKVREVI